MIFFSSFTDSLLIGDYPWTISTKADGTIWSELINLLAFKEFLTPSCLKSLLREDPTSGEIFDLEVGDGDLDAEIPINGFLELIFYC